ncbi:acyl-CoA reductase [Ornithinibacillus contaminans]|uniref:acyl-CoA reductase n=1 Tax=Ornithinibacillus contaminans TaxID=694055 RepID=UPI00064D90DC|nr:acyl-CoA reductase [Ornithinibacillus contaminans]
MHFYWPKNGTEQSIEDLQTKSPLSPFNTNVLSFIQSLSKRLIRYRQYPEIVALGYWMRKSQIAELQVIWERENKNKFIKARGIVFHIAPSNVDTIFIYSWILSLLAGNCNIIRISGKVQQQKNILLSAVFEELSNSNNQEIADRTIVLTYPHQDNTTEKLSLQCHTRVVWGGDNTVNTIRKIPLSPMANELVFPDRFAVSIINAEAVIALRNQELQQLAEQFYNDAFWFDQMACSSPKLILWTGCQDTVKNSKETFWNAVEQVVKDKNYEFYSAVQVQKLATGLWLTGEDDVTELDHRVQFSRVLFESITPDFRERHCGGGLFYEQYLKNTEDIAKIIVDKDQTISYFGYSREELISVINQIRTRGIDRIVPIGKALEFQTVWDGQNFLKSFSREVVLI